MEQILRTEEIPILQLNEVKDDTDEKNSEQRQFSALSELKGFLIGALSSLFFAISLAAVNQMKQTVHHWQLNGYRYLGTFLFILPYFCWKQVFPKQQLSTKYGVFWFLFLLTCNCGWSVCNYASVVYISVGVSGSITQVGEMLLAAIATGIISRKIIGWIRILSVLLGTVGILCLYQKFIFFGISEHEGGKETPHDTHTNVTSMDANSNELHPQLDHTGSFDVKQVLGVVLAVAAGALDFGSISTLSFHLQDLKPLVLFFWVSLFGVASSFLLAWPLEPNWTLPDNIRDWAPFFTQCFCFTFGFCLSWLPLYHASIFITTLSYTTGLVFLFVIQWLILGDVSVPPSLYIEVVGGVFVMISSFSVPLHDVVVDKRKQKQSIFLQWKSVVSGQNWLTQITCTCTWSSKCVFLAQALWVRFFFDFCFRPFCCGFVSQIMQEVLKEQTNHFWILEETNAQSRADTDDFHDTEGPKLFVWGFLLFGQKYQSFVCSQAQCKQYPSILCAAGVTGLYHCCWTNWKMSIDTESQSMWTCVHIVLLWRCAGMNNRHFLPVVQWDVSSVSGHTKVIAALRAPDLW